MAEQTRGARHAGHRKKRDEKRALKRQRRRAEKLDPGAAPKRRKAYLRGWAD